MSGCCRVIAPLITLVVLAVLIIVVVLSINLHDANLPPTFEVYSASINSLTVNTAELTADWNILLSTKNPNHGMRVYYEATSFELFYKDIVLDKSTLPIFFTDKSATQVINMKPSVVNKPLDASVANDIVLSRDEHGIVEFGLNISTSIRFKNNLLRSHDHKSLKVVCYPLKFVFNNATHAGTLSQGLTCRRVE
ncbi:uncharacterized protein [Medicago truncatula]|uniref:uncharacterized protein n=1 Tax=Medicago truncatula TaxID=3880 RepID=UPI000D2F43AA|nr:uncharacterized protein LOC112422042 [Medicago truncatula]